MDSLEAYELIRFVRPFRERLHEASAALAHHPLDTEHRWIADALERVPDPAELEPLLRRATDLPELADARADQADGFQQAWVDAIEKLLAGITFHVGARVPLVEALFPSQKFAPLRRGGREVGAAFQGELERRLKTSYVSRILGEPDYAFAPPVIAAVQKAYADWQACFEPVALSDEDAAEIRGRLASTGERLQRAIRQARLIAEAALVPIEDEAQVDLSIKPKKRVRAAVSQVDNDGPSPQPSPGGRGGARRKA